MTNVTEVPGGPAQAGPAGRSRVGPTSFGNGPVVAAGVMVGGAMIFAGWGLSELVSSTEAAAAGKGADTTITASDGSDGSGTVTLPDRDGDGIPNAYENESDGETPGQDGGGAATGRSDEDKPDGSGDTKKPETQVYVIESGDTLTEISGETGVPIGILVETNQIQNPNLIYAGASLLIPPAQ